MADVFATKFSNVPKPEKDGEETAAMFDGEHEVVKLVEEDPAFATYLLANAKKACVYRNVLKTGVAKSSLGMPFDGELGTFAVEIIRRAGNRFVDHVPKLAWEFKEREGTM